MRRETITNAPSKQQGGPTPIRLWNLLSVVLPREYYISVNRTPRENPREELKMLYSWNAGWTAVTGLAAVRHFLCLALWAHFYEIYFIELRGLLPCDDRMFLWSNLEDPMRLTVCKRSIATTSTEPVLASKLYNLRYNARTLIYFRRLVFKPAMRNSIPRSPWTHRFMAKMMVRKLSWMKFSFRRKRSLLSAER